MSRIRANKITNQAADGAPTVENGLIIAGVTTVTGSINNLNLTGITTVTTLDLNGDLDVDGHTNLDNVSIAGVVTATTFSGSGASLTNLNASNIASGTVPTARLGSGTASSSTFLRGDSTFQTVNTDLVSDSSPQLGGMLESNGNNIKIADSDIIVLGTGNDLQISHTSNISRLRGATTNDIHIESAANFKVRHQDTDGSNAEDMLICTGDGAVELYFNNSKKIESTNTGAVVTGILTATAFVPTSQGALSHRNIIINGAMMVAQRATSATGVTANGYATVDRFTATQSGTDDYIEQHQVDVSSGTTPCLLYTSPSPRDRG